jgi:tripartite-type tricarboxylate transporter receptor subunit TctC
MRVKLWVTRVGAVALASAGIAGAQEYPNKPIRIYANQPGGIFDFMARIFTQGAGGFLGQPLIVDNRPGNIIPAEIVAKAPPDGYSLLSHGVALATGALVQKMPYDPLTDFVAVSWTASAPLVVTLHPSVPAKSVKELIALAKARPGALNYASTATGSTPHLAAELFKHMTGVKITHIPYKGAGAAMIDMISGQVQVIFAVPNAVVEHAKTGRLRTIAVTSAEPSVLLPGLPTVAASGVPGYESVGIYGVFAAAKTPDAIIRRVQREIVRIINTDDAKKRMFGSGMEPVGSTPEQFDAKFRGESARMEKVIKASGIRIE